MRNIEKGEEVEADGEGTAADDATDAPFAVDAADVGESSEAREDGERADDMGGDMGGTVIDGGGGDDVDAVESGRDTDPVMVVVEGEDELAAAAGVRLRCLASASVTMDILQPTQYVGPSLLLTSAV